MKDVLISDVPLEVIEGNITDFHWDRGTVNLLEQIQKNSTTKNAAAAAGLHGIVASSAMLAMYDGEDVENFICRIDDKVVCGQFSGANRLKNGDKVKAVVMKKDELFVAEAILRPRDEVLWLPIGVNMGRNADLRLHLRTAKRESIFLYLVFLVIGYLIFGSKPLTVNITVLIILFLLIPPVLTYSLSYFGHKDMRPMSMRAEKIFIKLGLPYPTDLDMTQALYSFFEPPSEKSLRGSTLSMSYYKKALDFEKERRIRKKIPLEDTKIAS